MTPSARADALSDAREAEATAHTLNYALGRRHMKSWMNTSVADPLAAPSDFNASPLPFNIRKRGRPRKYTTPESHFQQHATEAASPMNAPLAEKPLSSNSTSPQLANIVATQHNRCQGNVNVTVLPSPTPSEEDTHNAAGQYNSSTTWQSINIDAFDVAPIQSPDVSSTATRESTGLKRPAGGSPASREKRIRVDTAPIDRATATASTSNAALPNGFPPQFPDPTRRPSVPHAQHGSPMLNQPPSRSPSFGPGQQSNSQMASPQLVQAAQHWGHPPSSRSNPSPAQGHFIPNLPARQTYIDSSLFGTTATHPQAVLPSQPCASDHADWYTAGVCTHKLMTLKASYSVAAGPRLDGKRLQLLEEAVQAHDWAYLTLHQYYCLMTHSPRSLPTALRHNRNVSTACGLMGDALDDNAQLSAPFLSFFCNFPFPIDHIASTWPARFQRVEAEFISFMDHSMRVGPLMHACERRRIPPAPREFACCAVTSLIFQGLLLRSVIRRLWRHYPHVSEKRQYEDQVVLAFQQELVAFHRLRATGQPGSRHQVDQEYRNWAFMFTQITTTFEAALRNQGLLPFNAALPPASLEQQPQSTNSPTTQDMVMSRSRQQPPSQGTHRRSTSQTHSSPQPRQASTPLLPRPGVVQAQQRVHNPARFSLHQAHLRSPVLQARDLPSPTYYFWEGFVRRPRKFINPNNMIEKLTFQFSEKEMQFVAAAAPTTPGAPGRSVISENLKTIRLRCVKWLSKEPPKDETWAVAENCWIPYAYFTFNGTSLQLRKKLHYGKDLPVDLTGLVRKGQNTLEVSVMSHANDTAHRNYLVAIEFLGVMTKASSQKFWYKNRIPADKTLNDIKRKLSIVDTDDDDITIVESTLTINLRDPFSAFKICDTPVRSTACLHNECFDLDTFLETRPQKGDVSAADHWRCPICNADARPPKLAIDDFLVQVRTQLERTGLLDTRAIVVDRTGSWKPKPEHRDPNGVQDRDTPEPAPAEQTRPPVVHEVIELDSD